MRKFTLALCLALLLTLSACGQRAVDGEKSSVSTEPTVSVPEKEKGVWTDKDLDTQLEEYGARLVELRESEDLILVRYTRKDELTDTLALVDREGKGLLPLTSSLVEGSVIGIVEEVGLSNQLFLRHPGTNPFTSHQVWPTVERIWLPRNPLEPVISSEEPYLMSREQSFSIGNHSGARVERITLGSNKIYFEFLDNGGLFVGGNPITPVMEVSFEGEMCTVFFPNTILDGGFEVSNYEPDSDFTPIFLSAEDTPEGAKLQFSCGRLYQHDGEDRETRWYIRETEDPITWLPRATLYFEPYWNGTYPQGW